MLDDLRNSSSFIEDDEPEIQEEQEVVRSRPVRRRSHSRGQFLGMTAQQRFIISLVLFFMVCILGTFALFVSGSIALPF